MDGEDKWFGAPPVFGDNYKDIRGGLYSKTFPTDGSVEQTKPQQSHSWAPTSPSWHPTSRWGPPPILLRCKCPLNPLDLRIPPKSAKSLPTQPHVSSCHLVPSTSPAGDCGMSLLMAQSFTMGHRPSQDVVGHSPTWQDGTSIKPFKKFPRGLFSDDCKRRKRKGWWRRHVGLSLVPAPPDSFPLALGIVQI